MKIVVPNGDFAFLHGLKESTLYFRRGTVDLIGEQQIGKNRALVDTEFVGALVQDFRPQNIRREQVNRELNASEL